MIRPQKLRRHFRLMFSLILSTGFHVVNELNNTKIAGVVVLYQGAETVTHTGIPKLLKI